MQPTAEDQEALYNARSLLGLVNPPRPAGGIPDPANFRRDLAQAQKLATELQPLLPELLPGILLTGAARSTSFVGTDADPPRAVAGLFPVYADS